jgi:hypothetical protein
MAKCIAIYATDVTDLGGEKKYLPRIGLIFDKN